MLLELELKVLLAMQSQTGDAQHLRRLSRIQNIRAVIISSVSVLVSICTSASLNIQPVSFQTVCHTR